jgi:cytochrome P450
MFKEIMSPAFHFNYIKTLVPLFVAKTDAILDVWQEKGGKNLEIREHLGHLTLDILGINFNEKIQWVGEKKGKTKYIQKRRKKRQRGGKPWGKKKH